VGGRAFVSVSTAQRNDPQRTAYPTIADVRSDLGPIAGIHAAQQTRPDDAWLVLACDLPYLGRGTLEHLIGHRAPGHLATAYRSRFNGKPEPLCAIYEPSSRASIEQWIEQGESCPRKWMARSDVALLDLPDTRALDNVNTAEEYLEASSALGAARTSARGASPAAQRLRRVQVRYFALLREQAGRGAEAVQTEARTPQELYAQLQRDRGLQLAPQFLRVAVNDEFGDWQQPLSDGDTVAFLPPVAGG